MMNQSTNNHNTHTTTNKSHTQTGQRKRSPRQKKTRIQIGTNQDKKFYKMDEPLLKEFYGAYLHPYEGQANVAFMLMIMARKKYYPTMAIKGGMKLLGRRTLRADKMSEKSFLKALSLLRLEASIAVDKNDKPIPPEACVYYVSANKLDEKQAVYSHLQNLVDYTKRVALSLPESETTTLTTLPHISDDYMSCLAKSARRDYVKLDVDTKDPEKLDVLRTLMNEHSIRAKYTAETRGGYHVLLAVGQNLGPLFNLSKKVTSELGGAQYSWLTVESPSKNPLLAVPGTTQGGFLVRPADLQW